ncbi:hypothetical protein BC834DRAFT_896227 [Gloeopeniophorella convolvens]|nr:hypothetical protein BC834DRAFT_896227 [Gloeopeniophorella convolvens]
MPELRPSSIILTVHHALTPRHIGACTRSSDALRSDLLVCFALLDLVSGPLRCHPGWHFSFDTLFYTTKSHNTAREKLSSALRLKQEALSHATIDIHSEELSSCLRYPSTEEHLLGSSFAHLASAQPPPRTRLHLTLSTQVPATHPLPCAASPASRTAAINPERTGPRLATTMYHNRRPFCAISAPDNGSPPTSSPPRASPGLACRLTARLRLVEP